MWLGINNILQTSLWKNRSQDTIRVWIEHYILLFLLNTKLVDREWDNLNALSQHIPGNKEAVKIKFGQTKDHFTKYKT